MEREGERGGGRERGEGGREGREGGEGKGGYVSCLTSLKLGHLTSGH